MPAEAIPKSTESTTVVVSRTENVLSESPQSASAAVGSTTSVELDAQAAALPQGRGSDATATESSGGTEPDISAIPPGSNDVTSAIAAPIMSDLSTAPPLPNQIVPSPTSPADLHGMKFAASLNRLSEKVARCLLDRYTRMQLRDFLSQNGRRSGQNATKEALIKQAVTCGDEQLRVGEPENTVLQFTEMFATDKSILFEHIEHGADIERLKSFCIYVQRGAKPGKAARQGNRQALVDEVKAFFDALDAASLGVMNATPTSALGP